MSDIDWLEGFQGDDSGTGSNYENYTANSDYQGFDFDGLFGDVNGGGVDWDSLFDGFKGDGSNDGLGSGSNGGAGDDSGAGGGVSADPSAGGNWYDGILKSITDTGGKLLLGTNKDGTTKGVLDSLTSQGGGSAGLASYLTPALTALLAGKAANNLAGDAGPAPDVAGMVNPSLSKLQSNADAQSKFLTDTYDWLKPHADAAVSNANAQSKSQAQTADDLAGAGRSNLELFQKSFRPATERAALDASGYSYLSPEEQEAYDRATGRDTDANRLLRTTQNAAENFAANQAGTSVDQNFSNQRAEAHRKLAAMGVNPNSGRSMMLADRDLDIAQAVGKSGAEWKARTDAKESGIKARQVAVDQGQKILQTGDQLMSDATRVGSQAVSTAGAGIDLASKVAGIKNGAFDAQSKAASAGVETGLRLGGLTSGNWQAQSGFNQKDAEGYGKLFGGLGEGVMRYFTDQNKSDSGGMKTLN